MTLVRLAAPPRATRRRNRVAPAALWLAGALLLAGCATSPPPDGAAATTPAAPAAPAPPLPDTSAVPPRHSPSALPAGWHHGVFMEIFVRAYVDSDGDGIGDLRGLISRLDYLQALGVSGLWLMPITASADGDHGYATTDFRRVEPAYGTLADVDELIRQAHARGIGVIMDYVVNHSASASAMFRAAAASRASPWRPWYVWEDAQPAGYASGWDIWGKEPWYGDAAGGRYLATFGAEMPDFNLRHGPALDYHVDSLRFWLNRGLDGFRLDAVPHLIENNARDWNDQPESRAITRRLQALIKAYPQRYSICEATAQPRDYAAAGLCGAAFAFGLESQLVKAAQGDAAAIAAVARYPAESPPSMGVFVSNHDQFAGRRLWDQAGGDEAVMRLTAATYLLLPGTPFVYYGEEIGQAGASGLQGDAQIRGPMSWTADARTAGFSRGTPFRAVSANVATHNVAAQQADPASLLAHYRRLIALRQQWPALAQGRYEQPVATGSTLSFQRRLGEQHLVLTYNYGRAPAQLAVAGLPAGATLVAVPVAAQPAGAATLAADAAGIAQVPLAAQSFAVWQVRGPGQAPATPRP